MVQRQTPYQHEHEEERPVLTTEEARQGETSGHVRLILAGSLALALVVFLILYGTMID
jgi:hypothetical protein